MGNACVKSCKKEVITLKKTELNVEELIKSVEPEEEAKLSLFNVNKKSSYTLAPKISSRNFSDEKFTKKRIDSHRKLNSRKNFNLDVKKNSIKENSFMYFDSDLSKGSYENENIEISKKNTFIKKPETSENKNVQEEKEILFLQEEINEKYENLFLEEINYLRQNLWEYSEKIRKYMDYILTEEEDKFILSKHENHPGKSRLYIGEKAFYETIDLLIEKKISKTKLNKLEFIKDLKIPFPNEDIDKSKKISYVKSKFKELKNKLKGKYELTDYHMDITFKDVEFSTVMQIVDDNKGNKKRQKNLLNKENKYIGISCKEINNDRINVYFVFAK